MPHSHSIHAQQRSIVPTGKVSLRLPKGSASSATRRRHLRAGAARGVTALKSGQRIEFSVVGAAAAQPWRCTSSTRPRA